MARKRKKTMIITIFVTSIRLSDGKPVLSYSVSVFLAKKFFHRKVLRLHLVHPCFSCLFKNCCFLLCTARINSAFLHFFASFFFLFIYYYYYFIYFNAHSYFSWIFFNLTLKWIFLFFRIILCSVKYFLYVNNVR